MDCHKADNQMMKYMDGTISDDEDGELRSHMESCGKCREDFKLYSEIVLSFTKMELTEAPEGFTDAVMAKVRALQVKKAPDFDTIVFAVCGVFFVLVSIGFIVALSQDFILSLISSNPSLSFLTGYITGSYDYAAGMVEAITAYAVEFAEYAVSFLTNLRYVFLAIFCGITITFFAIQMRKKA